MTTKADWKEYKFRCKNCRYVNTIIYPQMSYKDMANLKIKIKCANCNKMICIGKSNLLG